MRTHGWSGAPPADDDEAMARILAATRVCLDRSGAETGLADVARELGVTRQTVYRYFASTDELLLATSIDASAGFLTRVERHLAKRSGSPAELVVEALAFTLEQLPAEPYLGLLLTPGRLSVLSKGVTSSTALALGRAMFERYPIDWGAHGFDDQALNELVEHTLRLTQSFVIDPGTPPRRGRALRDYLMRWLAPAVAARSVGPIRTDLSASSRRNRVNGD
jgi:AcrR family transcriptional regulator